MDVNSIKKSLEKRRQKGGCGMWKNVGIPFMYKYHKNKLSNEEISLYEKKQSESRGENEVSK